MKRNKLTIVINKPIAEVFSFTITPPNSTYWIPGVMKEETSERPVRVGTIFRLQYKGGRCSEVVIKNIRKNKMVEWISRDGNYHCQYVFKANGENTSELEYLERVDKGELTEPFTIETLKKLKDVLEGK